MQTNFMNNKYPRKEKGIFCVTITIVHDQHYILQQKESPLGRSLGSICSSSLAYGAGPIDGFSVLHV